MSAAKKKQRAAPTKGIKYAPRTPAQRAEEVFKDWKSPTTLTDEEARHWARVFDEQAEYEKIFTQVPRGRSHGKDRDKADLVRKLIRTARAAFPRATAKALRVFIEAHLKQRGDKSTLAAVRAYAPERWANLVSQTAPRRS